MHTPGMHTPRGGPQGGPGGMGQKYPSMQSVQSLLSQGYLPPGHGYVPKPIKPDKPYGPTFITVMNRTWRGPGRKYLQYALVVWCIAILFLCATGLYWGHRNVSRMIVLRTEWFGAIFAIIFICLWGLTFHLIYKARVESNRWRSFVRFRSEGLYKVVAYNDAYEPEDDTPLETGTYGAKALKEIPKPRRGRGRRGRSRGGSTAHTPGGMYDRRGPTGAPESIPEEGPQPGVATPTYAAAGSVQASSKPRYAWPGTSYAQSQQQRAQYSAPSSRSGYQGPADPRSGYQGPADPRSGYQGPADPHLDPRRYAAHNVGRQYPVAGATAGKHSESLS